MVKPTSKPSVLIVDDIEANLLALEGQLGTMNCDLIRARSGNEALAQLLKRPYAVMLLDVQMPGMDGYEVARLARENPDTREVPIIFLTAMLETEESELRGYGTGAVDVLFKPINTQILRGKVQVFLDLYMSKLRLADEVAAHKRTLAELEAFNYSVSHDLRAPLRPLEGFARVLIEDYGDKLDDTGKEFLTRIQFAAQRMSQLIDDMLQLSRVSRASVRLRPVDLAAIAQGVVDELRRDNPARDVEFIVKELNVEGDPNLLRIALENLLRNAWKFTQKKPHARVELGSKVDATGTSYFVKDDGVGFDAKFASKLFRPFERLHAQSDFEGTGIGLAIVDRVVRHHGGRVWAESVAGEGATFYFTLSPG